MEEVMEEVMEVMEEVMEEAPPVDHDAEVVAALLPVHLAVSNVEQVFHPQLVPGVDRGE